MRPLLAFRHLAARIEMGTPIATAQWADPALVEERYSYQEGDVWLGRSPSETQLPVGYHDDRHVCLVSGSRAGKGTSSIITNLCLWPGSFVVVDPKGENATVTAPRRGKGSANCDGLGQSVQVLDPFSSAQVDNGYRSRFNPLDALNPDDEETVDEAARIADALVVIHDGNDPFWDESARAMVKALILHVLTAQEYEGRRNLITLRKLITRGDWEAVEALREAGEPDIPPGQGLLWTRVAANPAFEGIIAGLGDSFTNMLVNSPKQFESVLQVANRNTEFIDSPAMQRCLEASDFTLSALKTDPKGVSLYLCLPQRYMNTHYRWLRMMISLTVTEMEIVRGRPATGHPILIMLDEFAGLKRMEVIEHAVAQIAGYGVKLFFVLQSLEQLKAVYKDNWETFLSNSGLKIFFSLDDHFSRDYVSKLVGETEVIREARSASESDSESESFSHTVSRSRTRGRSVSDGTNWSDTDSQSTGINSSRTRSRGGTFGRSWNPAGILGLTEKNIQYSRNRNWSKSRTEGTSQGWSHSHTGGGSHGTSESESYTQGESFGTTHGTSRSHTTGMSETIHKRALVTPDEIGHLFARINDPQQSAYPGLALVVISGERTIALRRVNYFEDYQFAGLFEPHPDYPSAVRWRELTVRMAALLPYNEYLQKFGMTKPEKTEWQAEVGEIVSTGDPVISFQMFERIVNVRSPFAGMITRAAGSSKGAGYLGLFSLRYRETGEGEVYPFEDLVGLVRDLGAQAEAQIKKAKQSVLIAAALGVLLVAGIIATRELGLLAAIGLVGFWAVRKMVEASKYVRRLQAYPYKLLDPASRDDSWRVVEDLRAEISSANLAQPTLQSTSPAEPEKAGSYAPSTQPGVLPAQVIQPAVPPPAPEEVTAAPPAAPTSPAAQEPAAEATGPAMQEVETAVVETPESSPEFRVSRQGPPGGEGTLSAVPDVQAETVACESSQPAPVSPAALQAKTQRSVLPERPEAAPAPPIQPVAPVIAQPVPEAPVRPKLFENKQVRLLLFAVAAVVAGLVVWLGVAEIMQQPSRHTGPSAGNSSIQAHVTEKAAPSSAPVISHRAPESAVSVSLVRTVSRNFGEGLAFSPDGRMLAFGTNDGAIVLWGVQAGAAIRSIAVSDITVASLAFSPGGGILASGTYGGRQLLWNPATGRELKTLPGNGVIGRTMAFSPDGSLLAVGSGKGTIDFYDIASGTIVRAIATQQKLLVKVAFSTDGLILASCDDYGSLKLWDVRTGADLRTISVHGGSFASVAFSADGRFMAAALDRIVKLWDMKTGKALRSFRGHTHAVDTVAFSPDGRLLASGGNDFTIRIWDVATGVDLKTLWGDKNYVGDVAFSPDGRFLASGSGDRTVRLWRVSEKGKEVRRSLSKFGW